MIKVAPSILSADFSEMGRDVEKLAAHGRGPVRLGLGCGSSAP